MASHADELQAILDAANDPAMSNLMHALDAAYGSNDYFKRYLKHAHRSAYSQDTAAATEALTDAISALATILRAEYGITSAPPKYKQSTD